MQRHLEVLRYIEGERADLAVFPELSLANYAPEVARAAALAPADERLAPFQRYADRTGTSVGVGAPVSTGGKPRIGLLVFRPGRSCEVIGKQHLHADERPFFSPAPPGPAVLALEQRVGVAICYELTVEQHTAALVASGAEVYVASVAKTAEGVREAEQQLARLAREHRVPALLVNSVGTCEGKPAGGGSVAVGPDGKRFGRLGGRGGGVLLVDTLAMTARVGPGLSGKSERE
jgi:predicted amidohydrolase